MRNVKKIEMCKVDEGIKENLWSARLKAVLHFTWGKGGLR